MTTPRDGKREQRLVVGQGLGPNRLQSTASGRRAGPTLSQSLASPLGILIVLPAIVLAVGVFLTLVGQAALKGSNVALGQRRLSDQAKLVAQHLHGALDQADPMLDQLAGFALGHDPSKPLEPVAAMLLDVMRGHPGVGFVSISFADGTFQGTQVDKDGALRFQDSRVHPNGTKVNHFDYVSRSELRMVRGETTSYDPRQREFYRLASEARERIWTKPYPFFGSLYTGVTRAMPVYRGQELHAVLTVDFDVRELSRFLHQGELADMRTLLFARDGTLLAFPQGEKLMASLPLQRDRALSYRDLHDPTLDAFFTEVDKVASQEDRLLSFRSGDTDYVATLAAVGKNDALGWRIAYVVPERVFFESLRAYGWRSFTIAALAVLVSLGVAIAFARLIVRVRREVAEAREEARSMRQAARELGSYRLVKRLGKGGMGEVWLAEHRLLAREAAIKLIRLDSGAPSTSEAQERFRREAQSLAALRSRNTIELFDYGVADDGTFFYVMELLDGLDLESLVIKHGPQPPGRVLRLLMQACRSLGEAHEVGLVHRDIKPANLFVCRAADEVDVVKVLDFGLVRSLTGDEPDGPPLSTQLVAEALAQTELNVDSKLTRAGSVMGTPEFMAPEQALGHKLDGRADVYALGCVGYWLLTGELVFPKNQPMQILLAHIQEPPPALDPQFPEGLRLVLMDCLAKSPDQRPQSARALLQRLSEAERALAPEQQWTDERAQAWWQEHQPPLRTSLSSAGSPSPQWLRVAPTPEPR